MRSVYLTGIIYAIIINLAGFIIMGVDKNRARTDKWRVKEKTLFFIAFIGGSVGSILGMQYYHHKTKHLRFVFGMPVILFIQIALIIYIFNL